MSVHLPSARPASISGTKQTLGTLLVNADDGSQSPSEPDHVTTLEARRKQVSEIAGNAEVDILLEIWSQASEQVREKEAGTATMYEECLGLYKGCKPKKMAVYTSYISLENTDRCSLP